MITLHGVSSINTVLGPTRTPHTEEKLAWSPFADLHNVVSLHVCVIHFTRVEIDEADPPRIHPCVYCTGANFVISDGTLASQLDRQLTD